MKISLRTIVCALVVFITGALSAAALPLDKYTIERDQLPEAAREFLTTYFPKAKVGMIKVDKHLLKKTDYDVKLVNGTKIEFSNSGAWTSVDCKTKAVPEGLIIKPIRRYLNENFNGQTVVKIEKKTTAYELELADGVEIKFDRLGNFKSIDMD